MGCSVLIGELSKRSGASARSLRYYEQQGILTSRRSPNGYRDYDDAAADRVAAIRTLLDAGLPMNIVRDVMACVGESPSESDCDIAPRMQAVRDRLSDQADRLGIQVLLLDRFLELARRAQQGTGVGPVAAVAVPRAAGTGEWQAR